MTRDKLKAALSIAMGLRDGQTLSEHALEEAGLYGPPREPSRDDKADCIEIIMEWFGDVERRIDRLTGFDDGYA